MKQDLKETIVIPNEVEININGSMVSVKGKKGEIKKKLLNPVVLLKKEDGKIILESRKASKREKMMVNTFKAHIKNLIYGVQEGYTYKLKICSSHFPMSVAVMGNQVIVKNFFGEKHPRKAKILDGVTVKINGDEIVVEGLDLENVSQTAGNLEQCTRRTTFDRRIFQDGIYITQKAGRQ